MNPVWIFFKSFKMHSRFLRYFICSQSPFPSPSLCIPIPSTLTILLFCSNRSSRNANLCLFICSFCLNLSFNLHNFFSNLQCSLSILFISHPNPSPSRLTILPFYFQIYHDWAGSKWSRPRSRTPCLRSYSDSCGSWSGQGSGRGSGGGGRVLGGQGGEAEEHAENLYNHRAATTAKLIWQDQDVGEEVFPQVQRCIIETTDTEFTKSFFFQEKYLTI